MIAVYQTIFQPPSGNCWAACVASILERPLWTVPNFAVRAALADGNTWFDFYAEWLAAQDIGVINASFPDDDTQRQWWGRFPREFPIIATIKSSHGPWNHCIVVDPMDGSVLHDPRKGNVIRDAKPISFDVLFTRPKGSARRDAKGGATC